MLSGLKATKDEKKNNCSLNDQNNFDAGDMVEPILLTDYIFQLKFFKHWSYMKTSQGANMTLLGDGPLAELQRTSWG